MIHKVPPPALPASRHSLCQHGHRRMISPPNHGVPLMHHLQQRPGERYHRRRRPVRVLSSTTMLLGILQ